MCTHKVNGIGPRSTIPIKNDLDATVALGAKAKVSFLSDELVP